MNILITAGGTKEKIDDVRYIANHSTGRLGSIIADTFAQENIPVTYVHGYGAILPSHEKIKKISIFSAQDLAQALEEELKQTNYTAVIHSMAVSDYTMDNAFSQEELLLTFQEQLTKSTSLSAETISELLAKTLTTLGQDSADKKISSDNEHLLLRLKKTPKVIKMIKTLQPETLLIGFKLLVDVSEDHLIDVASNLLQKNNCDYVLANDLKNISGDIHRGLLVGTDKSLLIGESKQEIANNIVRTVKQQKEED